MHAQLPLAPAEQLSARASEILHLLAEGLSDREIAERLMMTINTVKWYNRQIYSILGVGSRTQAIARARDQHLLPGDDDPAEGVSHPTRRQATPHWHLPVEGTRFIGRKPDLEAITRLLQSAHLLTLVGAPGTGKTRLALHLGWELTHSRSLEAYFVALSPISDPGLVIHAIAGAVGIHAVPGQPLMETVKRWLHGRSVLLILDNFEHVLPAGRDVAELLTALPRLQVLATSREPLHIYGEQEYTVTPLELPDPTELNPQVLAACEATALFLQQAKAVRPDFELTTENAAAVARICTHLEGIPLAIELAAARVKLLTPHALLARLQSRLNTLTGGAQDLPARQQTLRNTIAWSYHLLDADEQRLFARLAVFAGGWTLSAAEHICEEGLTVSVLDGLESLMDKSLIQPCPEPSEEPRFLMLETIREYAQEQLQASGQDAKLRARHAAYFITFAEESVIAPQDSILTTLENEQNNFRAVMGWSLAGDPEPGLRLIGALGTCWRIRSYLVEGYGWAQRLLGKDAPVNPIVRAHALSSASRLLATYLGNHAEAEQMSHESLELAQATGDAQAMAAALYARGVALLRNDLAAARHALHEAFRRFQDLGDHWHITQVLNVLGEVARLSGDDEEAERYYLQAHFLLRQIGNPWGANIVMLNLATIAHHQADRDRARRLFTEGLLTSHRLGDQLSVANSLIGLASILADQGQFEAAAQLFGAAEAVRERIGVVVQPGERTAYARWLGLTRSQLDSAAFEAAWAAGAALPLEEMVASGLGVEAEPSRMN
jgi:predicted ATPase/DNA-binding CsgD family transcriptional regulator